MTFIHQRFKCFQSLPHGFELLTPRVWPANRLTYSWTYLNPNSRWFYYILHCLSRARLFFRYLFIQTCSPVSSCLTSQSTADRQCLNTWALGWCVRRVGCWRTGDGHPSIGSSFAGKECWRGHCACSQTTSHLYDRILCVCQHLTSWKFILQQPSLWACQ